MDLGYPLWGFGWGLNAFQHEEIPNQGILSSFTPEGDLFRLQNLFPVDKHLCRSICPSGIV